MEMVVLEYTHRHNNKSSLLLIDFNEAKVWAILWRENGLKMLSLRTF